MYIFLFFVTYSQRVIVSAFRSARRLIHDPDDRVANDPQLECCNLETSLRAAGCALRPQSHTSAALPGWHLAGRVRLLLLSKPEARRYIYVPALRHFVYQLCPTLPFYVSPAVVGCLDGSRSISHRISQPVNGSEHSRQTVSKDFGQKILRHISSIFGFVVSQNDIHTHECCLTQDVQFPAASPHSHACSGKHNSWIGPQLARNT